MNAEEYLEKYIKEHPEMSQEDIRDNLGSIAMQYAISETCGDDMFKWNNYDKFKRN